MITSLLFCMIVNTTLQNNPMFATLNPDANIPELLEPSTLLSTVNEGKIFSRSNVSFIGRNNTNPSQPFNLVKTTYVAEQNSWTHSSLPLPPSKNSVNAGLKWTQDIVGNMWIIVNAARGPAGNGQVSNLLYVSADYRDVRTMAHNIVS